MPEMKTDWSNMPLLSTRITAPEKGHVGFNKHLLAIHTKW
jgi:hypothetical protein